MKTIILSCLFFSIGFMRMNAQDTLTIRNEGTFLVRVIEKNDSVLKYTLSESSDSAIYSVDSDDVLNLNHTSFVNDSIEVATETIETPTPVNLVQRAKLDATQFYDCNNCGDFWVGFSTVLTTPLIGWVPALIVSAVPPAEWNLNIKDYSLRHNTVYYDSYLKKAHQIKRKEVWGTYGEVSKAYMEVINGILMVFSLF